MATSVNHSNPYVGPRAFQTGERIHGREHEASQLMNLIIAERIVLLYSPSGAGKTSLIQAALLPRLIKNRFQVLPTVRVNLDSSGAGNNHPAGNRYVFSALMSLEEGLDLGQQADPERLAGLSLKDYLAERVRPEGALDIQVMIFDQFEEILTLDPTDLATKHEFFRQVGEALEPPNRWALFAMREDHIAGLDPYRLPVPSRLVNTFRLDLLGEKAARQAIQQPAREAGVEFDDAAADKLVDDLRRVRVQQPDGSLQLQLGPHVEPVQLQVVCHRLWETPRPDEQRITERDLAAYGEVNQSLVDKSLASYYAQRVAAIAAETGVSERSIREWFDRRLITEQGVRGTVLMGSESSGELENTAVRELVDAYLVRGDKRAGATWFELSHDRLIGPVRADNAAWFKANLSQLQQRADIWDREDRSESLLLRGEELTQAREWAASHESILLPAELDYLAASEEQAARAQRLRLRNQIISILGIVSMLLAILVGIALRRATVERDQAQRQTRIAHAGQLAAQSQADLLSLPPRSMLLAVEALNTTTRADEPRLADAEEALRGTLKDPHGSPLVGPEGEVKIVAFSPDGEWIAAAGTDNAVRLWPAKEAGGTREPRVVSGHKGPVTSLAFSPDGRWLATGSEDTTVRVWNWSTPDPVAEPEMLHDLNDEVYAVAFSPDSRWLATGSLNGMTRLWDMRDAGASPVLLPGHTLPVRVLAFSPDGHWLATASDDKTGLLWDLTASDAARTPRTLAGHNGLITALAFSPDSQLLATGSRDYTARLWDLSAADPVAGSRELAGHEQFVNALAFSPDGAWLATGSGDRTARLWLLRSDDPTTAPIILRGHEGAILALSFSPDGDLLATAGADRTARVWDLRAADPSSSPLVLRGHEDSVNTLAFSPVSAEDSVGGRWLATGSSDKTVRLWAPNTVDLAGDPLVLRSHEDQVNVLAISSTPVEGGGAWLATGGGDPAGDETDNAVRLWRIDASGPTEGPLLLAGHERWIETLAFSPDAAWLASGSGDNTIRLWDLRAPDPAGAVRTLTGHEHYVSALAFSPATAEGGAGSRWLASGSQDGTARLWDLSNAAPSATERVLAGHTGRVTALGFSPDARWLATASDFDTFLWDLGAVDVSPIKAAYDLGEHSGFVTSLAFSPDGRWLATGSDDKTVRLWDLRAANPSSTVLPGAQEGRVTSLAFSPDGRWLASGSANGAAQLWQARANGPAGNPFVLLGHTARITALSFSWAPPGDDTGGRWLATGSEDRTVRLWDLHAADPSGEGVELRGHSEPVTTLAFSPAGADGTGTHWLVTGSEDHTVRLWSMSLDGLIGRACAQTGRNLTADEWEQYFPNEPYRKTCPQWP